MRLDKEKALLTLMRLMYPVAFILLVFFNTGWFSRQVCDITVSERSSMNPTPITPSGYAFSIWGLIWFLQACFCLWCLMPLGQDFLLMLLFPAIIVAWMFEASWSICFVCDQLNIQAFLIIMATCCFAVAYVVCFFRLPSYEQTEQLFRQSFRPRYFSGEEVIRTFGSVTPPTLWHLILQFCVTFVPTSMNFAWLLCASQIGVLISIQDRGVDINSSWTYEAVPFIVATAIGVTVGVLFRDPVFPLVLMWAVIAILAKHTDSNTVIICTTASLVCLCAALIVAVAWRANQLYSLIRARFADSLGTAFSDEEK